MATINPNPFSGDPTLNLGVKYDNTSFTIEDTQQILAANKIFRASDIEWNTKFSKFGCIDPYNTPSPNREYLFFTKPNLIIFKNNGNYTDSELIPSLNEIPYFNYMVDNYKDILVNLSYSKPDVRGTNFPFMPLLTNAVTSKLELPTISADSQESTANLNGTTISYRGNSYKSDNGYDFSLSVTDTSYLEIYHMVKAYDEYLRLMHRGLILYDLNNKDAYGSAYQLLTAQIVNKILPEQFSIYKFIIGEDGEMIKYYAKFTGVYFTEVPRSDFGDPPQDGFKYSLSFHTQFVEDNNPTILYEFDILAEQAAKDRGIVLTGDEGKNNISTVVKNGMVNNEWCSIPYVAKVGAGQGMDRRLWRENNASYRYLLKWYK